MDLGTQDTEILSVRRQKREMPKFHASSKSCSLEAYHMGKREHMGALIDDLGLWVPQLWPACARP